MKKKIVNNKKKLMNLKYFRKYLKESSERLDMTYSMMHILIYAYHSEYFTKTEILENVPLGTDTIQFGMKKMKDKRLINTLRGGGNGTKALYNISGFGKREIKMMYNKIKQTGEAENLY
tara:strand:+ start:2949 stop:3305 length:357 start_codon:yes stop_codon:yes gene_type:complete